MMKIREIIDVVTEKGWWIDSFTGDIIELATQLGRPVPARNDGPLVDSLRVQKAHEAYPNSLSARHGTGAFPLHSDGAHHAVVPKYIVLRQASDFPNLRGTIFADFRSALTLEDQAYLKDELWIVRTGRRAFLAPVLDRHYLRYDPTIMMPASPSLTRGPELIRIAANRAPKEIVRWKHHVTAVVDNHRVLHGREAPAEEESSDATRMLERVLVKTDELEN